MREAISMQSSDALRFGTQGGLSVMFTSPSKSNEASQEWPMTSEAPPLR